jgi:DNA modification methylase
VSYLIVNGDSRHLPLDLSRVDAVISDPPYGIGEGVGKNSSWASRPSKWRRADGFGVESWDGAIGLPPGLPEFSGPIVIWGGNYFGLPPSRGWLVWSKPDAPPSMADVELGWTNLDMNSRIFPWSIGAMNAERVGHPTQKPIALMRWCIRLMDLPPDSLILDPYMGSGTTLIAAIAEGHRAVGIEVDRGYCEVARRRLERPHGPVPRPGRAEHHPLFAGLD